GPVEADRLPGPLREGALAITDKATGERVPYEEAPGSKRRILFFAKDVPGVGYRSYSIAKSEEPAPGGAGEFPLEVSWDAAGWIASILDRGAQRQLVKSVAGKPFGSLFLSGRREDFRLQDVGAA